MHNVPSRIGTRIEADEIAEVHGPVLMFPTSPEAVAQLRERASLALSANGDDGFGSYADAADAVLRALGFTDA